MEQILPFPARRSTPMPMKWGRARHLSLKGQAVAVMSGHAVLMRQEEGVCPPVHVRVSYRQLAPHKATTAAVSQMAVGVRLIAALAVRPMDMPIIRV